MLATGGHAKSCSVPQQNFRFLTDPRRPERVFLREGSPEIGTLPVFGDPSRKKTRSGRRGSVRKRNSYTGRDCVSALNPWLPSNKQRDVRVNPRLCCRRDNCKQTGLRYYSIFFLLRSFLCNVSKTISQRLR